MYRYNGCRKSEQGAITVFLALIFISIILLAGAVIDIVRIAAADRKIQSVLNSSARSVLASYDRELMGEYGIYGVNASDSVVRAAFMRYLRVNLEERHDGIRFMDIQLDEGTVELQGASGLLDDAAFDRQIQEYMKYRTPIYITDNLLEQLQNIKLSKRVEFAKSEKTTRAKARELRTKANEVNAKLSGIKKKLTELSAEKLEELSYDIGEVLSINGLILDDTGRGLIEDYNDSREDTNIKAKNGECIENQSEEFSGVEEANEILAPELKRFRTEVQRTNAAVKPLLRELKVLKEELESLKGELEDLMEELADLKEDKNTSSESISAVREAIREVKKEISRVGEEISQLESRIDKEMEKLKSIASGVFLEGYSLNKEDTALSEKETEGLRKKIGQMREKISKALVRRIEKNWLISQEDFNSSSAVSGESLSSMDFTANYSVAIKDNEAETTNDTIIKNLEVLVKALEEGTENAAGKLNTIEYVMDKYTFLTSKTERNHFFNKGEVEYIICGADAGEKYNALKNTEYFVVTDVLLQVWALRFAIDTIDEFVRSAVIFPPQRLAFALAEGALDSCLDMFNMLNGEGVSICPKSMTSIKLKYSDHLRILLLMRSEEEIQRKARQLVQVNIKQMVDAKTGRQREDFSLGDYSTVISASVTAKVNLYFLPLLKVDKLLPGSFENGRYILKKQIHVGY